MTMNPQSDALRAALRDREEAGARIIPDRTDRPYLVGLADRLATVTTGYLATPRDIVPNVPTLAYDDLVSMQALAHYAAVYGYPRPPLEQLGAQAGHLPTARTSDPHTSHDAGAEVSGRPSTRNQLGRLLVAFRIRETGSMPDDPAMTSEEAATRAGISPTSEYAKRCSDLTLLGYIRVAQDADGHDRTRKGRSGMQRLVFELTADGRRLADDLIIRRG